MFSANEIKMCEKNTYDYIHIDENNKVHVLISIIAGKRIGTDNTCRTTEEIKKFFGINSHGNEALTGVAVINTYISHLEADLALLAKYGKIDDNIYKQKNQRLHQLRKHLEVLRLINTQALGDKLKINLYPNEVLEALADDDTNSVGINLSPLKPDNLLRITHYLFAAQRWKNGAQDNSSFERSFVYALQKSLEKLAKEKKFPSSKTITPKEKFYQLIQNKYRQKAPGESEENLTETNFNILKTCISEVLKEQKIDFPCDFKQKGTSINLKYIDTILGDTDLFSCCDCLIPNEIKDNSIPLLFPSSPFDDIKKEESMESSKEKFSIRAQFFLGLANVHFYQKYHRKLNFAQFIDKDKERNTFIATLEKAITEDQSIEAALIDFLNHNILSQFNSKFDSHDKNVIIASFAELFPIIKDSPHFDDFLIFLLKKPGKFYSHNNRISLHIASFVPENSPAKRYFEGEEALASQITHPNSFLDEGILNFNHQKIIGASQIKGQFIDFAMIDTDTLVQIIVNDLHRTNSATQIKLIKSRKDWPEINTRVFAMLSEQDIEHFAHTWNDVRGIYISKDMEQNLLTYYGFTNSTTLLANFNRLGKFQTIFKALTITGASSFTPHNSGGMVITFDKENTKAITTIKEVIDLTSNILHISPKMADSLDRQAKANGNTIVLSPPSSNTYTDEKTEIYQILKSLLPDITIKTEAQEKKYTLLNGAYIPKDNELLVGFNHYNGFVVRAKPEVLNRIREFYASACSFNITHTQAQAFLSKSGYKTELGIEVLKQALDKQNISCFSVQANLEGFKISCEGLYKEKLFNMIDIPYTAQPSSRIIDKRETVKSLVFKDKSSVESLMPGQWGFILSSSIAGLISLYWKSAELKARRYTFQLKGLIESMSPLHSIAVNNDIADFYQDELIQAAMEWSNSEFTFSRDNLIRPFQPRKEYTPQIYMNTPPPPKPKIFSYPNEIDEEIKKRRANNNNNIGMPSQGSGFFPPPIQLKFMEMPVAHQKLFDLKQITNVISQDLKNLMEHLNQSPELAERLDDPQLRGYLLKKDQPVISNKDQLLFKNIPDLWKLFPLVTEGILDEKDIFHISFKHKYDTWLSFVNSYDWTTATASIDEYVALANFLKNDLNGEFTNIKP